MAHVQKRTNGKYRVRYRDPQNRERSRHSSERPTPIDFALT